MRKVGESPQGFESFHSNLTRASWHNLLCMDCLSTIKSKVVGFCLFGVDATLSDGCGI